MQDLGYGLRRMVLLRGWVNRGDRSDPTPYSCFVAHVLCTELPLQIALLALDHAAPDHAQRDRKQREGPRRPRRAVAIRGRAILRGRKGIGKRLLSSRPKIRAPR